MGCGRSSARNNVAAPTDLPEDHNQASGSPASESTLPADASTSPPAPAEAPEAPASPPAPAEDEPVEAPASPPAPAEAPPSPPAPAEDEPPPQGLHPPPSHPVVRGFQTKTFSELADGSLTPNAERGIVWEGWMEMRETDFLDRNVTPMSRMYVKADAAVAELRFAAPAPEDWPDRGVCVISLKEVLDIEWRKGSRREFTLVSSSQASWQCKSFGDDDLNSVIESLCAPFMDPSTRGGEREKIVLRVDDKLTYDLCVGKALSPVNDPVPSPPSGPAEDHGAVPPPPASGSPEQENVGWTLSLLASKSAAWNDPEDVFDREEEDIPHLDEVVCRSIRSWQLNGPASLRAMGGNEEQEQIAGESGLASSGPANASEPCKELQQTRQPAKVRLMSKARREAVANWAKLRGAVAFASQLTRMERELAHLKQAKVGNKALDQVWVDFKANHTVEATSPTSSSSGSSRNNLVLSSSVSYRGSVNYQQRLRVTVHSVTDIEPPDVNFVGEVRDPFVTVQLQAREADPWVEQTQTSTKMLDTLNPEFEEVFMWDLNHNSTDQLVIELYDWSRFWEPKQLAFCPIRLSDLKQQRPATSLSCRMFHVENGVECETEVNLSLMLLDRIADDMDTIVKQQVEEMETFTIGFGWGPRAAGRFLYSDGPKPVRGGDFREVAPSCPSGYAVNGNDWAVNTKHDGDPDGWQYGTELFMDEPAVWYSKMTELSSHRKRNWVRELHHESLRAPRDEDVATSENSS